MTDERMQILDMVEQGVITAEEGARLLQAFRDQTDEDEPIGEAASPNVEPIPEVIESGPGGGYPDPEFEASAARWKRWWMIPLWIGVGVTGLGSLLIFWAYQTTGLSFWFGCAWLPFLLGLAVIVMAWSSRTARWLHLRVQQRPGEWPRTIAFSFPLPLRLAAWFLRAFGRYIPQLRDTGVDEMILALSRTTGPASPLLVEVDEGENGERVQIYIG
ncbi:MAG TPA: hypothetical protein VI776_10250 [Anaerolineales bacterium]|nr:hypothetical protein [Anaerolineales bacterium]